MFKWDNAQAQVSRLIYTEGKAEWRTIIGTYQGYLTDVGIRDLTDATMYGRVFNFSTDYGVDIKESDDIMIWTTKYSVKNVFHKKGVNLAFTRCVLIIDA